MEKSCGSPRSSVKTLKLKGKSAQPSKLFGWMVLISALLTRGH